MAIVRRHLVLAAMTLAASLAAGTAFAQASAPTRIRATITAVSGDTLSLKARDGHDVAVTLTHDARVVGVSAAGIGDIRSGVFIGCAAIPGDGMLKALEVTLFPPSMNGTGEGHYAWDLGADSTMTNGTVGDVVAAQGRIMTVKYKGEGEQKILVSEDTPIVSLAPGDRALLTVGAHVIVVASPGADGALTASRINVGVNGVVPPM